MPFLITMPSKSPVPEVIFRRAAGFLYAFRPFHAQRGIGIEVEFRHGVVFKTRAVRVELSFQRGYKELHNVGGRKELKGKPVVRFVYVGDNGGGKGLAQFG
jgi:hypothetical protein